MRDTIARGHVDEAFRGLLEFVPDAMLLVDDQGLIVLANAQVERLFGYSRDELLDRSIDMLVPEASRTRHAAHRTAFLAHPHARPMGANQELVGLRKDGTEFALEISLGPLKTEDGLMVACAVRDITARRASEGRLKASEARLRSIIEHASDGIFITNTLGEFLELNSAACGLLGYAREELLGKTIADVVTHDELPRIPAESARLRGGGPVQSAWQFQRKDGSAFAGEVNAGMIPEGRLLAFLRDITERKKTEEELRRSQAGLAEAQHLAGLGNWELEVESGQLRWSDEVFTIFEFRVDAVPSYARFLERVHPEDRERVDRAFRDSIARKQAYDIEHRVLMPDGRVKHLHERSRTDCDETGKVVRSVGTVQDVTLRVLAEDERRQLEHKLRQAQKMEALGTLAGGIAHDFNNILSAILGNLELVADEIAPSHPAQVSLREARNASQRARDLVGQILTFSRQRPQERDIVDLRIIVQESLGMLRPVIPAGVELVTSFAADIPAVRADRTQMHQVLINLCNNAWQAMETRTGRIAIALDAVCLDQKGAAASPELHAGHYVRLSVSDSGAGMDAATAMRIFDPFFTTKSAGEGTGLGLAVVHGIMRAHDGAVILDPRDRRGTTFHLYFPAVDALPDPARKAMPEPLHGEGQPILYLDDERQVVDVVCRMLEKLGYQAAGFTQPKAALEAVRGDPYRFAMVILDYNMPGLSGLDVAREILGMRPNMPVALCSGFVTDALRDSATAMGVRDVLYKPYSIHELGTMIHAVISEPASRN